MENREFNKDKIVHGLRFLQSLWTFGILYHLDLVLKEDAHKVLFVVHFIAYLIVILGRFIYIDKNYYIIQRTLSVPLNVFLKVFPILAFILFVRVPGPVLNILLAGSTLTLDFIMRDYTRYYLTKEELRELKELEDKKQ